MMLGYCSNVHPGSSLDQVLQGLERHAVGVHERLGGDAPLPLGLWLGADALDDAGRFGVQRLRDWLGERSLRVFAMNGFPFGDFHHEVVKHDVYRPDWTDDARTHYTLGLAELLAGLLDAGESGSVSTVPLGWGAALDEHEVAVCAGRLRALCAGLEELEDRTGRCIHVDLEPEPGCAIERLDGLASFFERHLLGGSDEARVRRHLRACVDCCHAAVMYEDFARGLEALDDRSIRIGRVQVSNALEVDMHGDPDAGRAALEAFRDPRWLHQVMVRDGDGDRFHEDLEAALVAERGGRWRIHFHVPVHLETLGPLGTTQSQLVEALDLLRTRDEPLVWEVETYAWSALPDSIRPDCLADGIAAELQWTRARLADEKTP
ncbi:MAG: metabolite traffic protein EboE [Planctomycetota bacterium]|nr:metabolite traffic protein EboE [Planctomycetota bacterium]